MLAHAHPRIASFAVPHLAHPDASVAIAAVTLLFGTRCDTAALYALDALRHPQPAVARATVAGLRPLLALRPDVGVARRLVRWVEDRAVPRTHAEARAAAVALLGEAGWLGEAEAVGRLRKDRDPAVAAAAVRALAVLQPYPSAPLGARATVPQLPGR
ncbi:MAG: hypothetical protein EXR79_16865 [Myxococcales bacterium]|nr:hypothetical protein [Myxococcales bacterium]